MGVGASGCGNPANSLARMASARSAALNAKPPRYVLFPADGRLADICPELMVSCLLCERLEDHEALRSA